MKNGAFIMWVKLKNFYWDVIHENAPWPRCCRYSLNSRKMRPPTWTRINEVIIYHSSSITINCPFATSMPCQYKKHVISNENHSSGFEQGFLQPSKKKTTFFCPKATDLIRSQRLLMKKQLEATDFLVFWNNSTRNKS